MNREAALERLEELARSPQVRERLEEIAANSRSERRRAWARRYLERLDAEYGPPEHPAPEHPTAPQSTTSVSGPR